VDDAIACYLKALRATGRWQRIKDCELIVARQKQAGKNFGHLQKNLTTRGAL
jgi:hypothetical protein